MTAVRGGRLTGLAASVWTQDLDDFEWIVVDDGSSDGTWELLSAQGDPRLRAVRHARNRGQVRALGHAIALTRGRFVKFADADDVLRPGCLRGMASILTANPPVGLVFGRRELVFEEPADERARAWAGEFGHIHARFARLAPVNDGPALLDEYLRAGAEGENWLAEPSGVMVRRACLEQAGGPNVHMRQTLDMDLWMRIMATADVAFLDEVVFDYRVTVGRDGPRGGRPRTLAGPAVDPGGAQRRARGARAPPRPRPPCCACAGGVR